MAKNESVLCMGTIETSHGKMGCGESAKFIEFDSSNWHDWLWCNNHACNKKVEPLTDNG